MILDNDKNIKKQTNEELDKLPINITLLKKLGYWIYDSHQMSYNDFQSYTVIRTVIIHIPYKHPRKYGYFKEKYGKLQDEITLYGEVDYSGDIRIRATLYLSDKQYEFDLVTMGNLREFLEILLENERIEAEKYNLQKRAKLIERPIRVT